MNLLLKEDYYKNYFEEIYVFCPTILSDPKWRLISLNPKRKFKGFDEEAYKKICKENEVKKKKILFIFSDCGSERIKRGNYMNPLDRGQMNARHDNASYIFDAQNVCSLSTPTRQNCDGACIYEQPNYNEIQALYHDFGRGKIQDFSDILEIATKEPYSFLFVHRQGPKQTYLIKFHTIITVDQERSKIELVTKKRKIECLENDLEKNLKMQKVDIKPLLSSTVETESERQKTLPLVSNQGLKTSNPCG